ncbi:MAG TPA: DUF433 domain-containing protein [Firmicutes bacterium]|jgi:uncharacterized protein (DUF433 family)|nr:hypothetical protein [Bacillota bacterium]HHV56419.1 DUF433 domain-containing protein [Bacillota bacterium]
MPEIYPGIVVDEGLKGGKPVIKGTRVPVEIVLAKVAGGATFEEIMREYDLQREDLLAAFRYAASVVSEEEVKVLP